MSCYRTRKNLILFAPIGNVRSSLRQFSRNSQFSTTLFADIHRILLRSDTKYERYEQNSFTSLRKKNPAPILSKLTIVHILCRHLLQTTLSKLEEKQRKNRKNSTYFFRYSTASDTSIFMRLIIIDQHDMEICCVEFHPDLNRNMKQMVRNSLTLFNCDYY